jgi:hypothetical protein
MLPFYINKRRRCYNVMTGDELPKYMEHVSYAVEKPTLVLTQLIGRISVMSYDKKFKFYLNWL